MYRYLFVLPLFLLFFDVFAQKTSKVEGAIVDTASTLKLENAIVTVLQAKDSIFVDHTRADADGRFVFSELDSGDYILVAIYPNYLDFVEKFTVDADRQSVDFGDINMMLVSELLEEVVITSRNAITIKGDTIEFDASQYTVQKNARVEDLLSQLPGFQVDMNGKITALGETISKVLVDGEEFFGDDPTLVTRNIRADMVDKVQLYDKKSDQAAFTGIDDGEEVKTVNIQLKEDSRHGTFGKIDAGIGTDDYYNAQGMINTFKGDKRLAAYGTIANNGKTDLGWQNSDRFLGSTPINITIGEGASFTDALDSFSGSYNGEGIPVARNGGAHYASKWNDKREGINANYKVGDIEITGNRNTFSRNDLPEGVLIRNGREDFSKYAFRHKADARYQLALDSTSTLTLSLEGTTGNNRTQSDFTSSNENELGGLLNQSNSNISNKGNSQTLWMDALWNKKLGKRGRTLSIWVNQRLSDDKVTGFLYSENDFFDNDGTMDSTQIVDQMKRKQSKGSSFRSNIAYTEPLSESLKFGINYGLRIQNDISKLFSYNQSAESEYNDLDSAYTSDFKLDRLTNELGATLNYQHNKSEISLRLRAESQRYKQLDRFWNDVLERDFMNFYPNARWRYNISSAKSFSVNYWGFTGQPSLEQLQPVRSNDDPLNIRVGNPDLEPSFRHHLNLEYRSSLKLTSDFFSTSLRMSTIHNDIVSNVYTDEVGKSVYRSDNLMGEMPLNLNAAIAYSTKLKEFRLGSRMEHDFNQQYHITNDVLNKITTNRTNLVLTFSRNMVEKYSFIFEGGPIYYSDASSLQNLSTSEGWGVDAFFGGTLYLPGGLEFKSENRYEYSEATQVFDQDFERLIMNLHLSKSFLKSKALTLRISANDLLDQNVGFRRTVHNIGFSQTDYTTVRRHFMFSLIWDFTTMGAKDN